MRSGPTGATVRALAVDAHRPLVVLAVAMVVLAAVCAVGLLVDPRLLGGQPVWAKPLKFSVSFVLYAGALALLVPLVRGRRASRTARWAGNALVAASVLEMVGIVGQAARGVGSHFNVATPFDAAVLAAMGSMVVVFWVATAIIGVVMLGERSLSPALRAGVGLGVVVSLIGMSVAFLMTQPTPVQLAAAPMSGMPTVGAHTVGVADGGPGLRLLGWSTMGGDLRIGHFVGLHALQALPLLALGLLALSARVPALRTERVRARLVVVVAAVGWVGLTLGLTWQALRGQPLIAPDGLTASVAVVLVVATTAATAAVLRAGAPAADPVASHEARVPVDVSSSPDDL